MTPSSTTTSATEPAAAPATAIRRHLALLHPEGGAFALLRHGPGAGRLPWLDDPQDELNEVPMVLGGLSREPAADPGFPDGVDTLPQLVSLLALAELRRPQQEQADGAGAEAAQPPEPVAESLQLCEFALVPDATVLEALDWWRGEEPPPPGLPTPLLEALRSALSLSASSADPGWPPFGLPGATEALRQALAAMPQAPGLVAAGPNPAAAPPLRQAKAWSLSSVWFNDRWVLKLPHQAWVAEPVVTAFLDRLLPGSVPEVLALGELRLPGAASALPMALQRRLGGKAVGEDPGPDGPGLLVDAIARLQLACRGQEQALLDLGVPQRGPEATMDELDRVWGSEELVDLTPAQTAALPELDRLLRRDLAELAAMDLPLLLCHGDLHIYNALLSEAGPPVLIDWTDVALSWPGVDLITMLSWKASLEEPTTQALVRRYAGALGGLLGADAERVVSRGLALAPAFHAVSYSRIENFRPVGLRWDLRGAVRGLVKLMLRQFGLDQTT